MLMLAQRSDGSYAADVIVVSIPRQVGKTYLVGCIIFALCLMKPGLNVIWTAQVKDTALETFEKFYDMAQNPRVRPHVEKTPQGKGDEAVIFTNGSKIEFGARDSGFGRGRTDVDVLVFDEGQHLSLQALENMAATQNVAANPLCFVMGTPPRPQDKGEYFSLIRDESISGTGDGSSLYIEMSADPGCDPMDREQWRKANPSFPHRTSERALLRLRKKLRNEDSWRREALGVWDSTASDVVNAGTWSSLVAGGPDDGVTPTAFGVSAHDGQFSVVACWADGDGRHVEEVFAHVRLDLATEWVTEHVGRRTPVWVSNYGLAAPMVPTLTARRMATRAASVGDASRGCELLMEGAEAGWLSHSGQDQLSASVAGARLKLARDGAVRSFDLKTSIQNAPVMAASLALAAAAGVRPARDPSRANKRGMVVLS